MSPLRFFFCILKKTDSFTKSFQNRLQIMGVRLIVHSVGHLSCMWHWSGSDPQYPIWFPEHIKKNAKNDPWSQIQEALSTTGCFPPIFFLQNMKLSYCLFFVVVLGSSMVLGMKSRTPYMKGKCLITQATSSDPNIRFLPCKTTQNECNYVQVFTAFGCCWVFPQGAGCQG